MSATKKITTAYIALSIVMSGINIYTHTQNLSFLSPNNQNKVTHVFPGGFFIQKMSSLVIAYSSAPGIYAGASN